MLAAERILTAEKLKSRFRCDRLLNVVSIKTFIFSRRQMKQQEVKGCSGYSDPTKPFMITWLMRRVCPEPEGPIRDNDLPAADPLSILWDKSLHLTQQNEDTHTHIHAHRKLCHRGTDIDCLDEWRVRSAEFCLFPHVIEQSKWTFTPGVSLKHTSWPKRHG